MNLKVIVLAVVYMFAACSCGRDENMRRAVPQAGVSLIYSVDWVEVSRSQLEGAYRSSPDIDKAGMPRGDFAAPLPAISLEIKALRVTSLKLNQADSHAHRLTLKALSHCGSTIAFAAM